MKTTAAKLISKIAEGGMQASSAELAQAEQFGKDAFAAGTKRAPALDKNIKSMMADQPVGGTGSSLMNAWLKGWDKANLSAPY